MLIPKLVKNNKHDIQLILKENLQIFIHEKVLMGPKYKVLDLTNRKHRERNRKLICQIRWFYEFFCWWYTVQNTNPEVTDWW